jgi:hypothetical protein
MQMTNQQHPITPPRELVQLWIEDGLTARDIATQAAQWGADQELEACCKMLRAARRTKPPSLKKQALAIVERHEDGWLLSAKDWNTIRRALEALPND